MKRWWTLLMAVLLTGCAPDAAPPAQEGGPAAELPGQIYLLAPERLAVLEGGRQRSIPLPAGVDWVTISPDQRWAAGVNGENLMLVPLSGGDPVTLPTGIAQAWAWAPDGGRIAAGVKADDGSAVAIFNSHGQQQARVPLPAGPVIRLAWRPDGTALVAETGPPAVEERSLWHIDPGAGKATLVAEPASLPAWAPDGEALLYASHTREGDAIALWWPDTGRRLRVDATAMGKALPELKRLFAENRPQLYWTGWSPSGSRAGVTFKAMGRDPRFVVLTLSPGGGDLRSWVLPVHPDHPGNRSQRPPLPCSPLPFRWALDEETVAVRLRGFGCERQLVLLDAATLWPRREAEVPAGTRLDVSPDGQWLLLWGESGEITVIRAADPDDRQALTVQARFVAWLP